MEKKQKIVVAYSGGLDTSVIVHWLWKKYDAEIITVTGNLGLNKNELGQLEEKALKTGAARAYIFDLQKEFLEEYVWQSLKSDALYEGKYPLACAIGRPLLAKKMVEVALNEGAEYIAHGCTGKGNDQVRFEVGIQTLAPHLKIIAPVRTWEFKSREDEIEYAIENNIPVSVTNDNPYSIDENLWGIAVECGVLEDIGAAPPVSAFQITNSPMEAPDTPQTVTIQFERGIPCAIDGSQCDSVSLVKKLNELGAKHGIGRIDMIENRVVGIKSREIYEAPAAAILHKAHQELETIILDKETFRFKQDVANKVANLIYDGQWYTPLFDALKAFVDSTQENISGEVTIALYKGTMTIQSRKSEYSLYSKNLATYSYDDTFDHGAAEGFMKLYGLPYKIRTKLHQSISKGLK
ncbi:MAG: argininosuccinate synthase [Chitinispirillia bacterium]